MRVQLVSLAGLMLWFFCCANAVSFSDLSTEESAAVQQALDGFYSLVKVDCGDWIQVFTENATFYQPKSGVIQGLDNLENFCKTIQSLFKVQELRQDGPFIWVTGAQDNSRLHVLTPAVYLNDSPYVNSEYQFFELQRVSSDSVEFKVDKVSELLTRSASAFTFPEN
eukprot:TRINITY_DN15726_c0_g1_i1.p1 TRINITY_DN15726_c0_g1~~TRINITY_DN15726_c0_g1_i1.p1  ORF type:complete len:167 (+),score=36.73 TRINITY_DN15726_c0_g1_i1:217-717(+)